MLRSDFIDKVKEYLDAEDSDRWSDTMIVDVGGMVSQNEWSDIVNQNRFYRADPAVAVTTDSSGRVAIADLTTGSGDSAQYFYRILTGFTDGNVLWTETDLDVVPLATQTNFTSPYFYRYYLVGDYYQLLPVQSGLSLTVAVNHTPPTISQLSADSSTIIYPTGYEYILVWVTAATLFMKGAAESQAASGLLTLANGARENMLGDIARRSTRPTFMRFPDTADAWGPSNW